MADVAVEYLPVAIFTIVAVLFAVGSLFSQRLFRPDAPNPIKSMVYECGEAPIGEAQIEFSFQYYVFAIIFVVADILAVFLILFGLSFKQWAATDPGFAQGAAALTGLFAGILLVGVAYALKKEAKVLI
jgi:NADH:ubiquinone oxidoreductase subunit 3 (subunit A)